MAHTRRELGEAAEDRLQDPACWNGERGRALIGRRRSGGFWIHRPGVGSEKVLIVKRLLADSVGY